MKGLFTLILLAAVTLAVYARTLDYPFAYDDIHTIVKNVQVRSLSNIPRFFIGPGMEGREDKTGSYRPLLFSTYALNYAISGERPWSYRAFQILLHILNSFLIYLLARALLGEKDSWLPSAAALVFCLHPVQTETVIYPAARSTLLVSCLLLASFYFYIKFKEGHGKKWLGLFLVTYALALLTKETAPALLPLFIFLEFYYRKKRGVAYSRALIITAALLTAVYMAARFSFIAESGSLRNDGGFMDHWLGYTAVLPSYLRLLFLPASQSVEYPVPDIISPSTVAGGAALLLLFLAVIILLLKRGKHLPAALLLLAGLPLLPEFVFPVYDLIVEYRLYLTVGAMCLLGAVLMEGWNKTKSVPFKAAMAAIATAFFLLSSFRAGVWASGKTLWGNAAAKYPNLARPHNNLGTYYAERKQFGKARGEFEKAVLLKPDYADAYIDLGNIYAEEGNYADAEAMLQKGISLNPEDFDSYFNLGLLYLKEGDEAGAFKTYVEMDKRFPDRNVLPNAARLSAAFKRERLSQALIREYQARSAP